MKLQILFTLAAAAAAFPLGATAVPEPTSLRTEYLETPLGLDVEKPRFYWQLADERRGARQTAYQLLVASSPEQLADGKADIWDSGKIESDQSAHVTYGGPDLESKRRYYWTVKVWDKDGKPLEAAKPTWWETGLMSRNHWKAEWIGSPFLQPETTISLSGMKWIWYPEGDPIKSAPQGTRYFRTSFEVPAGKRVEQATICGIADNTFAAHLNGEQVAAGGGWQGLNEVDVLDHLKPGTNSLAVSASNSTEGPAGLALALYIKYGDGTEQRITTGEGWRSANSEQDQWTTSSTAAYGWADAKVLGDVGIDPWGSPHISTPGGPASLLRKEFALGKTVQSARAYVTALGSYRLFINGERVGKDILTPDWTDYRKRVTYQTYDVTEFLKQGENAVGAILGDGWYASGLGWELKRFCFGDPPLRLLLQMEITYQDGSSESIISDGTWKWTKAPILRSEIYAGETYDARLEQPGWNKPSFDAVSWKPVSVIKTKSDIQIWSQRSAPIQATETLKPIAVTEPAPGIYVYDMGQNMVGWAKLKVKGTAGQKVRMRFAEILKPDGHIYRDNLRRAEATDSYILKGGAEESFEPHFTYHGFRYVELTGFPGKPELDTLTGVVVHTAPAHSGKLETSDELANKIWLNTLWGQRGNMHSVPTDCPQRDERLGWMADAQTFWRTASYNMDMAAFTMKWMHDVLEAQSEQGGFPNVAPRVIATDEGAPAWGDAGVIIPYTAYKHYGDTRIVQLSWDGMERWLNYIHEANPNYLWKNRRSSDFGDWVPANSETPKDLIGTAYWAYDATLMAEMAEAIGRKDDARKYRELFGKIRDAFVQEYIREDGTIGNGSQTCYVLALHMNLVPDHLRTRAVELLSDDIMIARKGFLSTGFLGTTYLMPVLSDNGRNDIAYKLLLNDEFPSWGYMIRKGATTIWERWNGDTGDPAMNSYNHFCYGAVSEWMYRYLAGIDTDPAFPGFKRSVIHPRIDEQIQSARTEYDSLYGKIATAWEQKPDGSLVLDVSIPANTSASVYVPASNRSEVTEGESSPEEAGLKFLRMEDGCAVYEVPAGSYRFTSNSNSSSAAAKKVAEAVAN